MPSYNFRDEIYTRFTIRQAGAKTNADSTPVATVYVNEVYEATLAVSNVGTGEYVCKYVA